ncbi:Hpt domain-containing protein [Tsuneonella sp. SYSU-LHT278]|uniref:Hpt domain-containing protein n=1 Tax=Tsuneonella sediminis TaxID=3416089 RepID=UPI003F793218
MTDALQAKLAELGQRFVAQAPEKRAALRDALARNDLPALASLAHRLAGNAGMFGFAAIGEAALAVEEAIDAGHDPHHATDELLKLLEAL